ncbi:MAG: hypothetical protein AB7N80_08370 [Bdellovibrionales bacterium]
MLSRKHLTSVVRYLSHVAEYYAYTNQAERQKIASSGEGQQMDSFLQRFGGPANAPVRNSARWILTFLERDTIFINRPTELREDQKNGGNTLAQPLTPMENWDAADRSARYSSDVRIRAKKIILAQPDNGYILTLETQGASSSVSDYGYKGSLFLTIAQPIEQIFQASNAEYLASAKQVMAPVNQMNLSKNFKNAVMRYPGLTAALLEMADFESEQMQNFQIQLLVRDYKAEADALFSSSIKAAEFSGWQVLGYSHGLARSRDGKYYLLHTLEFFSTTWANEVVGLILEIAKRLPTQDKIVHFRPIENVCGQFLKEGSHESQKPTLN